MSFTDLSRGDSREQGGCWLREWRHRGAGAPFGNNVSANLRGMLGADAGGTTNHARSVATAGGYPGVENRNISGDGHRVDIALTAAPAP